MLVANVLAAIVLALATGTDGESAADPSALVARLGSARYADRERAAAALESFGRAALPALRAAREAREPEIRARATGLIQTIEGELLTRPTRVRLEFRETPVVEAIRSFSQQCGFRIVLAPENSPWHRTARITIQEPAPMDFWKAVDRLRDSAGLYYNPGPGGYAGQRDPTFSLTVGEPRGVTPLSDHGPFRVSLLGIHYQRDLNFDAGPRVRRVPPRPAERPAGAAEKSPVAHAPLDQVQFFARIMVAAEPRMAIHQNGPLRDVEAFDSRGNSLTPAEPEGSGYNRYSGYFGIASSPVLQLQAPLSRPETPGDSIKKLRGNIPLALSARKPDPLVISLAPGARKSAENSEALVTVHDIRPQPGNSRNTLLELSIRNADEELRPPAGAGAGFGSLLERTDPQHLQVEVVDSEGHLIPWFPSGANTETSRVTLTLTSLPQTTEPKELRYYSLIRTNVNVPFEFRDLPMP
jgi:hypothetical protein